MLKALINILVSGCVLSLFLSCSKSNQLYISADHPEIRYVGRWNFSDPSEPWVAWSGSSVSLRFRGSEIAADIDPGEKPVQYRVVIDDLAQEERLLMEPGRELRTLASGLESGRTHTVELFKETYSDTLTVFHGFLIHGNSIVPLPPRSGLKIEFYGESNMEGTSLYSEKDDGEAGAYYAFPALVSRMLGAEMNVQAFGSARLAENGTNSIMSFIHAQDRPFPDPEYRSDFQPQIIVINAGANDATQEEGKPTKKQVKNRYKRIITSLRKLHGPNTHIILMNAYGWHPDEPSAYTREVVKEVGGNLSALLFPWMWEHWHGSMIEHSGQAHILAEHIESLDLGFSIVREADIFDGFGHNFDVANGSFEDKAKAGFDAFGWRYFDEGVQRIYDPAGAADGKFYIRLGVGQSVHQGTDASGDFEPGGVSKPKNFRVKAMIRSVTEVGGAQISADFEAQDLWQRKNPKRKTFGVNSQWQEFTADFTAPPGSWKTYITLTSVEGEVEFDNIRMSGL